MPQSSTTFHESEEVLTPATRDMHRAIVSLQEELEAIDWYQQRVEAAHDDELRDVLRHARDEEMEHASMVLEWIRRHSPEFDEALRARLFASGSILEREEALESAEAAKERTPAARAANGAGVPRVTVGSLREAR